MFISIKKLKLSIFRKALAFITKIFIRIMNIYIKSKAKT